MYAACGQQLGDHRGAASAQAGDDDREFLLLRFFSGKIQNPQARIDVL